ncbi:MAG: rRNA maturation RNase YbeY [Alphaproteobacteria bacterium]
MILIKNDSKLWEKKHENFTLEQAEKITKILKIDGEISIVLTNDLEIKKLNKQYRKKDSATNVLSFETGDLEILGDIILAFETIKKEAEEQKKTFEKHLSLMICHGILHLIGYDHIDDSDAEIMEKKEKEILEKI